MSDQCHSKCSIIKGLMLKYMEVRKHTDTFSGSS